MKLLYTCANNASDPHLWSGTVSNCRQALQAAEVQLEIFDQIPFECPLPLRLLHQAHKRLGRKIHFLQIEPAVLRRAAARIVQRFDQGDCAGVFCPGTGVPVHAYLPKRLPVISYLDATKRSWIGNYFGLGTLCARSRRQVDEVDRASLANNTLTIFSSDWARAEAERDYGIAAGRMAVVPFGANLSEAPTRAEVESWIEARAHTSLRMLFLGKEWERKGGPEALKLVRALRVRGLAASLDIVGCQPVLNSWERMFTRVHGFVDHSAAAGRQIFRSLLSEAHFLVFLSQAEAYGIALCEAAAFGVPAYANNVGGIPTVVRNGETGWLSPVPFSPDEAADTLAAVWHSPARYRRIALAARTDYETRLNWTAAGRSLKLNIAQALTERDAR